LVRSRWTAVAPRLFLGTGAGKRLTLRFDAFGTFSIPDLCRRMLQGAFDLSTLVHTVDEWRLVAGSLPFDLE
jgi:hypothetical protein